MRSSIVIVLACLMLTACGSTHKTVVVNAPPDSTTVVEGNGDTHVIERN
jgi:uncharacterized protein YcfL